jgi:RNA polymerase sigma-70 factor (ECF subfamily)
MDDTEIFERHRAHLEAVAVRILGSQAEAQDALQEAWIRVRRRRSSRASA